MKKPTHHLIAFGLASALALGSAPSFAGKIYMWHETTEDGNSIKAFGPTPPPGVEAVLVADEPDNAASSKSKAAGTQKTEKLDDKQQQLRAKRQQECEAERGRLATLQNGSTNIRMTLEDGSSRTLTPDEISEQIRLSQDFINNACG